METYNYGRQMDVERGVNYVQVKPSRRDAPISVWKPSTTIDRWMLKGGRICTGKTQPARPTNGRMETYYYGRQMDVERGRSMYRKKPAGEM